MRRVWSVAAMAAAILIPRAGAGGQGPSAPREAPAGGAVTALSVVPGTGRADVVIAVDGPVGVMDFTLEAPHRIVLDLKGATLGMPASLYDKVSRGGITNIRFAQYRAEWVRVVLELDTPREYTVVRGEHDVKVSVSGSDAFAPWRTGSLAKTMVTDVQVSAPAPAAAPPAAVPLAAPPVTVEPPRPAAAERPRPAAEKPAAASARSSAGLQSQEPRITITISDMHIRDVLAAFAAFARRTIIMGRTVDGFVNATIEDQPWDIALKKILEQQGLSALEDSTGIISVDSYTNLAEREKVEPLQTRVIAVNYAKAETMANTVKSLLGAGCGAAPPGAAAAACAARGTVSFDEKTNTVIVTETAANLANIESYIRDLDVRTPQVTIKAKIISVDRTGTEQLGLSYDLGSANTFSNALVTRFQGNTPVPGDFRVNLAGDGMAAVANASRPYRSTSALSLIYNMTLGGFNLTSFLDALASEELTDVQAEPSVTTVDNKEAELFAGSELAFLLTPPIIPGQIQSVAPQIQRQNIGITLRVTPHVTANRQVMLTVFAEQQTLAAVTTAGPSTNKRNSKNEVLVADGETAVIGGLTQTQVSKTRKGIPFLMSLPGIGRLFSTEDTVERKQDLLILITPHIVDEGEVIRAPEKKP
ncbi:MAG TPA: secretin N-terminal domain-containing protein [Gemmatimonadaceae bacterium]|nr:secretin N-terminal domain-containing protein [Gemmatimonadaceae bacterium]